MNLDFGGSSYLAERLELIRTISRNIAGTSEPPDARNVKTQSGSVLLADPTVDGVVLKDDRSGLSTDSAGRERAAMLSSMMQALRPPLALSGQYPRQDLNAALKQPVADLPVFIGNEPGSDSGINLTMLPSDRPATTEKPDIVSGVEVRPGSQTTVDNLPTLSISGLEEVFNLGADAEAEGMGAQPNARSAGLYGKAGVGWNFAASQVAPAEETVEPHALKDNVADVATGSTRTMASPALAARAADMSAQAELICKLLSEIGLSAAAAEIAPMVTERAGVLASFVLNAHFLPGWPPMRPIESREAKTLIDTLVDDTALAKSDLELLSYLANFGVSRRHLEKLVKSLKQAAKRPGLLQALACFVTDLSAALRALGTEVDAIVTDLTLEEQLQARHSSGNRRRIDLDAGMGGRISL